MRSTTTGLAFGLLAGFLYVGGAYAADGVTDTSNAASTVSIDQSTTVKQDGTSIVPASADSKLTIQQSQTTSQSKDGSSPVPLTQIEANPAPVKAADTASTPGATEATAPTSSVATASEATTVVPILNLGAASVLAPVSSTVLHHLSSTVHASQWHGVLVSESSTAPATELSNPAPVSSPVKNAPSAPLPLSTGYLSALMAAFGSVVTPVASSGFALAESMRHEAYFVALLCLYLTIVIFWFGLNVLMRRTGYARAPRGSLEPAHIFATSLLMSYVGPPARMQHSSFLVVSDTK